jgi:hypothetical protein
MTYANGISQSSIAMLAQPGDIVFWQSEHIQPSACPRYQVCGAPICPLDADWHKRSHLPEDRVCRWLTELAKPQGIAILGDVLERVLLQRVVQVSPAILAHSGVIRNRVCAAAKTGSKSAFEKPSS